MRYWLALGEPLVTVTVRFPRVKFRNKRERLRERAGAYYDRDARRFYGEKDYGRRLYHRNSRVAALLAERDSIMRLPRRKRKDAIKDYRVTKWW